MSPEQITIIVATITAIIVNLVIAYLAYYNGYRKQKGENKALIKDAREISYEQTKGQNLATKEDIEKITKTVENIKTELNHFSKAKLNLADKHYGILIDSYQAISNFSVLVLNNAEFNFYNFEDSIKQNIDMLNNIQKVYDVMICKINLVGLCYPDKKDINDILHKLSTSLIYVVPEYAGLISHFEQLVDEKIQSKDMDHIKDIQSKFETYYEKVYNPKFQSIMQNFHPIFDSYEKNIKKRIEELYTF